MSEWMKAIGGTPHISQSKWSIWYVINWKQQIVSERKPQIELFEMHPTTDNRGNSVCVCAFVFGCALGLSFGAAQIESNWIEVNRNTQPIESKAFHMISKLIPILLHLNFIICDVTAVYVSLLCFYWLLLMCFFFSSATTACCWCWLRLLFFLVSLLVFLFTPFIFHSSGLQFCWNRSNNEKKE